MMGTKNCLLGLSLGVRQDFGNMSVFPLFFPRDGGPEYITLREALERGVFVVSEVCAGGSVPELMVENKGDMGVLLLDGEELAGAKQNRILNTSVLIAPKSSTKIPVSCTEQGRWRYISEVFFESGNHMSPKLREINMRGVNASLRMGRQFRSDQGAVWAEVACESEAAKVVSPTGAMRDVFEARKTNLESYLKGFRLEGGQKGVLVFIGGEAAGLDFVSREQAFGILHQKLIKSYAMEAMLAAERDGPRISGAENGAPVEKEKPGEAAAGRFLELAAECGGTPYPSVGLGTSLRYEGREVIGSALAVDEHVVHMAFFKTAGGSVDWGERMASLSARRGSWIL